MSELSIELEWNLQEEVLKPDLFSKNHKIEINGNLGLICSNNFPTNKRATINLRNFLIIFFFNSCYFLFLPRADYSSHSFFISFP